MVKKEDTSAPPVLLPQQKLTLKTFASCIEADPGGAALAPFRGRAPTQKRQVDH